MNINLRLTEETKKMIRELAFKEHRSINAQILYIIEQYYNSTMQQNDNKKND